ncbi:hypothetical protein RhiirC2_803598 [Rhizophagus irregularis]|uniref:Uncharacterized protein n=1 Tax=Rhizophagus irregularis TaxID=588596 RepID=A0A2N1LFF6_9GLOM|nr:hypothetical protein RhiirC2_805017 [Rhizophagus irregularis]PKK48109.1 hypothetical protein RhiirC2_803598 [Rhizophagus irregularis]
MKAQSNYKARYICCDCYEKEGGHLYKKPGRGKIASNCHLEGKHEQDLIKSLELMNKWIISTNNKQLQMKILNLMVSALQILNSENNDQTNITNVTNTEIMPIESSPSLFTIKTIFKLYKIQINNSPEECSQIGFNLTENLKKTPAIRITQFFK